MKWTAVWVMVGILVLMIGCATTPILMHDSGGLVTLDEK